MLVHSFISMVLQASSRRTYCSRSQACDMVAPGSVGVVRGGKDGS